MKKLIFLSLLAIMALGATAQEQDNMPYVEVRGTASRLVEPNRIEVLVSLNEADSKGKIKLSELESDLANALKKSGVDASKQLVISSQSSSAQKKSGSLQFKNFLLTLTSANQLDEVFEAFASSGVQNAQIMRMYNVDQKSIVAELQVEAMTNSMQTAQTLALAIGQKIGSAIQIQYWDNPISPIYMSDNMLRTKSAGMESAPELPDDVKLKPINMQVSVTVRYFLSGK